MMHPMRGMLGKEVAVKAPKIKERERAKTRKEKAIKEEKTKEKDRSPREKVKESSGRAAVGKAAAVGGDGPGEQRRRRCRDM